MTGYLAWLGSIAKDHVVDWGLGDWIEVGANGGPRRTAIPITSTCAYYYYTTILAETATVLGKPDDAAKYAKLAEAIKASFNRHFFDADNSIQNYGTPLGSAYAGDGFPGLSVAYLRLPWAHLEPEEGRFNWSVVDTVAQRYIQNGKQAAFSFSCSESHEARVAIPEWVREAGAKGHWWTWEDGVVNDGDDPAAVWEPDYTDPVFLAKLDHFTGPGATKGFGVMVRGISKRWRRTTPAICLFTGSQTSSIERTSSWSRA